jgi:FtsH-binding integral membrane protein
MGLAGLGMSAAPMIAMSTMVSSTIVPTCMAITAAIFGGASLVAYSTPSDKMASMGRILGGSLIGLIALQVVGLLSQLIMGPNMLSSLLFRADNYLGILLFTGFIAYDTHVAIQSYETGNADHLAMSVQLLLDVWNIFIRLLSIFSNRN